LRSFTIGEVSRGRKATFNQVAHHSRGALEALAEPDLVNFSS
jgi:hypothetical protein